MPPTSVDHLTTTMTNYKQLCADLADDLELADWPWKLKESFRDDIQRARAALAQPEPKGPTQRQLLQLAAEFWPEGCEPTQATAYARAVLARWGNHPGSPDSSMQPQQSDQLMTKQLSPAAQAVFDSYKAASDGCYSGGEWLQKLLAIADELDPQ